MDFPSCLIGYTGFVGGVLQQQMEFTHRFNRDNVDAISRAPAFRVSVCAAAPSSMQIANRFPDRDRANLEKLMRNLAGLRTRRFVLISTIAVLADPASRADEASAVFETTKAYGRNRRTLEAFCEASFKDCLILRLPALFGPGLQKNFIFDLLNPVPSFLTAARLEALLAGSGSAASKRLASLYHLDPATELFVLDRTTLNASGDRRTLERAVEETGFAAAGFHHRETTYQYYDLTRLTADIRRAGEAGLHTLHLATEPLQSARIYERLLGQPMPDTSMTRYHEDMNTQHADVWGRRGPYLEDANTVLDRLSSFFASEMERA